MNFRCLHGNVRPDQQGRIYKPHVRACILSCACKLQQPRTQTRFNCARCSSSATITTMRTMWLQLGNMTMVVDFFRFSGCDNANLNNHNLNSRTLPQNPDMCGHAGVHWSGRNGVGRDCGASETQVCSHTWRRMCALPSLSS